MNTIFGRISLIALLFVAPNLAYAQNEAATLQTQAEEALVAGNPGSTVALANQMLITDPDSFAALFLLALAQSDLDQHGQAAATARRAYRVAGTEDTRLQAARLAATAHFRAGQFARSELWFRRAANHISTEEEAEAIVRGFQRAQTENPITTQYTASVAPSDNINNGSDASRLCFESLDGSCFLELDLREDQLSLSGLEYNGSAQFQYRLGRDARQETNVGVLLFGQGVVFSQETRDRLDASSSETVQELDESDFSALLAELSIEQRQTRLSPLGPTRLAFNTGKYWRAGDLLVNYQDIILAQQIPFEPNAAALIEGSVRKQQAVAPGLLDSTIYELSAAYNTRLANRDVATFTLAAKYNDSGEESTFEEYRLRIDYAYAQPLAQTRWSTFTEIGYRSFDEFSSTFDGRRDWFVNTGVTGVFEDISYFGFSPSVSLFGTQTDSDVSFIDSSKISLRIGLASNF
ncbi:MAG: hypothetical protein AAFQ09_01795 [Pseudomonadota bacterium]